jgi:rhodanese-related sulfurtransferase
MASAPHPDRLADVDAQQAGAMIDRGDATLIDVRELQEWSAGHAPEARHVPLAQLEAGAVSHGRPVIAVCRSGRRSAKAADILAAAGISVHNLAGGMQSWAEAGRPVVTDTGEPGTIA